jgi:hypothetical protein
MNETEIIIREMSQVTIDGDLLKQIDMSGLLQKFKENHNKLGDFKKARTEYENKGFFARLNPFDNTMKNAQLDATEIQAEFSKTLGQLMVVSIAQSRHLQQQQEQLTSQQNVIKSQTEKIEFQTHELDQQQERLAKQNADLEKLVNDYFELRGLTQDGAKKLISIANDIQHTKVELLDSMEKTHTWVEEQQDKTYTEVSSKILSLEEYTQKNVNDIIERCEIIVSESDRVKNELQSFDDKFTQSYEELSTTIAEDKTKFLEKYEAFDAVLTNVYESLNTHIANTEKSFVESQEEFNIFREKQQKKINNLTIIFGAISAGQISAVLYLLLT